MQKINSIAINTYRELVRGKILYSILFFAVLIVLVSAAFGSVSIGEQSKVVKDFGLFACSFFTVAFTVISGSALLHKELSKKTIFNILSKSVKRSEFILGKYLGILATVTVMLILMAIALMAFVAILDNNFVLPLSQAFFLILLQLSVVAAAAIFFSSLVVTPMLSGAFTFAFFIAGRSSEYLINFVNNPESSAFIKTMAQIFYAVIPHFDAVDVSNQAVYGELASTNFMLWSILYCASYAGILLALAVMIFKQREFK